MPSLDNLIIFVLELWLITGVVIILHRLSSRFGLTPLLVFLGGVMVVVQFLRAGWIPSQMGEPIFDPTSHLLLTVFLFGFLMIYIVNGTQWARSMLVGTIIVGITISTAGIMAPLHLRLFNHGLSITASSNRPGWILLSSFAALLIDATVLILVYQSTSNFRSRFPSRLAGSLALLTALWSDAIIAPLLVNWGESASGTRMLNALAIETIAGLALVPLISVCLKQVAKNLPYSQATLARAPLDLFSSFFHLEARTRDHYRLLHTLAEINKIIVRSTDAQRMFQQICELLVSSQEYRLAWLGGLEEDGKSITLMATAGFDPSDLALITDHIQDSISHTVIQTGEPLFIEGSRNGNQSWEILFRRLAIHAAGVFPLKHAGQIKGVLGVCTVQEKTLSNIERELIQDLADDLAYALVSLDARNRQAILQTATDSMQDGLIIFDPQGEIIYANTVIARVLGVSPVAMVRKNIADFLSPTQYAMFPDVLEALLKGEKATHEFEYPTGLGDTLIISMNASQIEDKKGQSCYIVTNYRDITLQQEYEEQLLALNRLTANLVQIHDSPSLLEAILRSSEEILHANASIIYLVGEDGQTVVDSLVHHLPIEYAQRIAQDYRGLPGETASQTENPVVVNDTLNDPVYGERIHFMADYKIRALLILPILFQDLRIGALTVYYQDPRSFQKSDIQLGLTLTRTLAITIQNARLYERISRRAEEMAALATTAATASTSLNLKEVLYIVAEQMTKTLDIQACAISDYDPSSATITLLTEYGPPGWVVEDHWYLPFDLKDYPRTRRVLETHVPCQLRRNLEDLDVAERQYMIEADINTLLMLPLVVQDRAIGLVELIDERSERIFTDQEIALGQTLASHAAIAIQNANLYQQLQAHATELEDRVRLRTQELQETKEHIEGILASVPDAVFVLDENNRLIQSNQAGEILLEYAEDHQQDLFSESFLNVLATSQVSELQSVLDIQNRSFQARASFIHLDDDKSPRQVIVFRDVTRFREIDQMKSRFISDVSHELRTPLTNLTLYLSLLESLDLAKEQQKHQAYLEIIQRETERLTHLIEDLLTISRIEAGKIGLQLQSADVNQIVDQLMQDRAFLAAQREIKMDVTLAENLPEALVDPNLLVQAVSNLLTNAINYTLSGGIITLQTGTENLNQRNWVTIHIKDNGVGIYPDEIQLVFERFYRGRASQKTGTSGTGLGLAIAKEIVIRMGGQITLQSAPQQGSTFTIWLRPAIDVVL